MPTYTKNATGTNLANSNSWTPIGVPTANDSAKFDNTVPIGVISAMTVPSDITWGRAIVNSLNADANISGAGKITFSSSTTTDPAVDAAANTAFIFLCPLELTYDGEWRLAAGAIQELRNTVSGVGKIYKTGAGIIRGYSANTFSGGVTSSVGRFEAYHSGALGTGLARADTTGGFDFYAASGANFNNNFYLAARSTLENHFNFRNNINFNGAVQVVGTGNAYLNWAATTGGGKTAVFNGAFSLGTGSVLFPTGWGSGSIMQFNGPMTGQGGFTCDMYSEDSSVVFNNTPTFTGPIRINKGILKPTSAYSPAQKIYLFRYSSGAWGATTTNVPLASLDTTSQGLYALTASSGQAIDFTGFGGLYLGGVSNGIEYSGSITPFNGAYRFGAFGNNEFKVGCSTTGANLFVARGGDTGMDGSMVTLTTIKSHTAFTYSIDTTLKVNNRNFLTGSAGVILGDATAGPGAIQAVDTNLDVVLRLKVLSSAANFSKLIIGS
jgi:hypothetical protein